MTTQGASLRRLSVHELAHAYTFKTFDIPVIDVVVNEPKNGFYSGVTRIVGFDAGINGFQARGHLVALVAGQIAQDRWSAQIGEERVWASESDYQYFDELRERFTTARPGEPFPDVAAAETFAGEVLNLHWDEIIKNSEVLAERRYLPGSAL